jgi:competence protein ComEC
MKTISRALILSISLAAIAGAAPLRAVFVDVEGGQATLFVSPSGQSLLVDTGWATSDSRDTNRILAAAQQLGVTKLNYVLITHYHSDHVGGVTQLASRIKIDTFIDHGPNREDSNDTRANFAAYEKIAQGAKRLTVKPGDHIPITGLNIEVVSSDGETLQDALPGAGQPNPFCSSEPSPADDNSENARSVGVMITLGKLRVLDLGDLTKKRELALACPRNLLGIVDLFVVTHHGSDGSNARALVDAIRPRVAIMDNGAHKGANPDVWQIVHDIPGLVDLWQLHYAIDGGKDHNVASDFIANPDENSDGKSISVTADANGTITVKNDRNGFTKKYKR